jgi:hypothetical protein
MTIERIKMSNQEAARLEVENRQLKTIILTLQRRINELIREIEDDVSEVFPGKGRDKDARI